MYTSYPADIQDENIVALLRDLVRINTEHTAAMPSAPYGRGCAQALSFVLGECERRGFVTHRVNDEIAWAQIGTMGPLVAFPVHLDVIPAHGAWSHDPYAAEIKDGVLYGRGCMDDKIGAALLMELLVELRDVRRAQNQELFGRFRIIFGTDEETGMADMVSYVAAGEEQPEFGFVPDASFPAVRGEKARLWVRISRAISDKGLELHAGTVANVVPDFAEACLADGSVYTAQGKSAHGSTPERGKNAAVALVHKLAMRPDAVEHEWLGECERFLCADLHGTALGIDVPDATFGHTSVNLGVLSVEDGQLQAELDIRFGSEISTEEVIRQIQTHMGPQWELDICGKKPLHEVAEDNPCLQTLLAAYQEAAGTSSVTAEIMAGGTYASYLPALVAFGPKLPGTHSGAHGIDEHVSLDNISRAAAIYRVALRNLADLALTKKDIHA